jgi:uncharacterized protein
MHHSGARSTMRYEGTSLAPGPGAGIPLALDEPLSFWGGVDAGTGTIIDVHHPQAGSRVAGTVLVLPSGRGSSSSSSVLAEIIRHRVGPAAILLGSPDPIIAIGSLVAFELYGIATPVAVIDPEAYRACGTARRVEVEVDDQRAVIWTD